MRSRAHLFGSRQAAFPEAASKGGRARTGQTRNDLVHRCQTPAIAGSLRPGARRRKPVGKSSAVTRRWWRRELTPPASAWQELQWPTDVKTDLFNGPKVRPSRKLQPFLDDPVQRATAILGQPLEQTRISTILVRREIQIPWHAAKLFLVFRPLIALTTLIAPAETSAIEAEHHQILAPVELRDSPGRIFSSPFWAARSASPALGLRCRGISWCARDRGRTCCWCLPHCFWWPLNSIRRCSAWRLSWPSCCATGAHAIGNQAQRLRSDVGSDGLIQTGDDLAAV